MQDRRERRSADQLLRSVIGYLEWRAGECWRDFSRRADRNDQERWDYLGAIRLVSKIRYAEPRRPQLVLPGLAPASFPTPTKQVKRLAAQSRAWLVDRIVQADAKYTDRKILMRLDRLKLATMLTAARTEARRTA